MTISSTSHDTSLEVLAVSPVIPVVVLQDAQQALPLAEALLSGGVGIIEVTLRTEAGLDAIARIARALPEMLVGAGTVITRDQASAAEQAGARFVVTPGSPATLVDAVLTAGLPLLAGASTLTEIMMLIERGHRAVKFFPAEQAGGVEYLRAVHDPLPQAVFCPTGGIIPATAEDYLALPNVSCVGGSWLTPAGVCAAGDWATVQQLAHEASTLGS
ncbi:MAG: bifunctional 4-hydroxy-2-oxoglutarate aldolase/2-dehydro-3-deoxy-phosphogluconate aldolase [Ornithinimicrobium sp.]|uniref:bifunctional 4-hydroxy-2-oxoglutarate aldolase/2-dehydro-3-deoxy-phosphogluconate aldolase n=1 Tax=Ornithinimicrobium sp. TaxID=1977084 RepID=UPI003D9BFAE1